MIVRPFAATDSDAVLAIWNPIIRDTTVSFSSEEKTADSLAALIAERRAAGREFFVADEGGLLGFASYAQFRGGNGYLHAMEHTIILSPVARGRGAGRALMTAIEHHARASGAHTLLAGVSGENGEGVAFHARMGFRTVATIPEVGRKFGRWLDLVLMMKILT